MHSRYVRLVVLSVLVLSLVATSAFAARRSSLGGNLLIPDTDDIFFFPHHVGDYQRHVTFDFGPSNTFGSGGMIWGTESMTFGAFAHRSNFVGAIPSAFFTIGDGAPLVNGGTGTNAFNDLLGNSLLAGVAPGDDVFNWVDAIIGFSNAETPIGIRVSVGRSEADTGDTTPGGTKITADATSFNLVAGAMISGIDVSGEFSYASSENTNAAGVKNQISPVHFSAALRKTATDASDNLQLGWLGEFSFVSGTLETTPSGGTTTKIDQSSFGIMAGAGPVYKPHDRTMVAFYGTIEYLTSDEDAGGTKTEDSDLVLPGWYLASEVEISSWLQARAGFRSRYIMASDKRPNLTPPPTDLDPSSVNLEFTWHTGLGIAFDNFHIDGYLDPSVLTTGTDLLGESDALFALVTASLDF